MAAEQPRAAETRQTETEETPSRPASAAGAYALYLFSSRSAEVAEAISRQLQTAGVGARVYAVDTGAEVRYRVAVPGFETRGAAETFSESVIGRFGITDAWVGSGNPGVGG